MASYPEDRGLRIRQALLYGENNQTDQATQALRPLLDHTANDLEIYLDLAQVYRAGPALRRCRGGRAHQRKNWPSSPADQENDRFSAGAVYERQKKYDQAEQAFQGVLAINPRNAPALNYYGYMLADRGSTAG